MARRFASVLSSLLILALALPAMAGAIGHGSAQNVLVICTGTERLIIRLDGDGTPKPLIETSDPCVLGPGLVPTPSGVAMGTPETVRRLLRKPVIHSAAPRVVHLRPPSRAPPALFM